MSGDLAADVAAVGRIEAVPKILEVVCRTTGMGFAAVARVTEDRWIACAVRDEIAFGLKPGGELKVATTICDEIRASGQAVIIDHVAEDTDFCRHPTPAMYGFQSYISMPIFRAGAFFGTLCAIDPRPARLKRSEIVAMFTLFADLIAFHLEAQDRLASSQAALLDERQTAVLREQFIAVLGHDLRNPLASIEGGVRMLLKETPDERAAGILRLMRDAASRMGEMIERVPDPALGAALAQVVDELRSAWPGRTIASDIALAEPVACDRGRLARLLSNLLANALTHGASDAPVRVHAATQAGMFTLTVSNQGPAIAPALLRRLFQPFFRGEHRAGKQGLGLGLYIASEIARAHGGSLSVASSDAETRFTLTMPVA